MKKFGKVLSVVLAVVALSVVALVIFIKTFDWNRARPFINEKVSDATGRIFVIGGDLKVDWARPVGESGLKSLLPWPTLSAQNVRIDNPDWAQRKQFATLDAVSFQVEVLPLLRRQIIVSDIALTNPVIDLERTPDARNTWTFKRSENAQSKWDVQLKKLVFSKSTIYVTDQPTKIDMRAVLSPVGDSIAIGQLLDRTKAPNDAPNQDTSKNSVPTAISPPATDVNGNANGIAATAKSEPAYGFNVALDGTYRGAKLAGNGKIGSVMSLVDKAQPFPLQVDVRLGDNHVQAVGTLTDPAKLAAVDLQLSLAANSMADLYDLLGVALPETPKFRTNGHLIGNFDAAGKSFIYENFTGQVGRSDLSGTVTFDARSKRPRLSGKVVSKRLALADLGPAIGGRSPSKQKTSASAKSDAAVKEAKTATPADKALPTTPFRTDRWKAMDVDVVFTGASIIRSAALPISDMSTHIVMDDSVLTLNPLKFGVAGGTVTGNVRIDGRTQPLDGSIDVAARRIQLKRLFPEFAPMDTSFGEINGNAKLRGRGNSPAALAATSSGEIKLLVNDGAISNTLLEQAGLNVANIVIAKLFGDQTVKINCAAADFDVKNGLVSTNVFALDTTDALINVEGQVNLANEQMMLNVFPKTKGFRIFSLRSPLYVRGTFKKPDVGVMKGPLALRGAAALALGAVTPLASLFALLVPSTEKSSPCPEMLAIARKDIKDIPARKQ